MNPPNTFKRGLIWLFLIIILFLGGSKIKAQTIIASDDFNRANETPLVIGGDWQIPFIGGNANLIGNQVAGSAGEALYFWQGSGTFDNSRQFARATVINANGQVGLILLGGINHALVVAWNSGTLYIYRYSGGSYQGNLTTVSSTLQNGDIIEALLDNGIVYAKINGSIVTSVPNTTGITSGNPGFEFYLGGAVFDDWVAGIPALNTFSITGNISENGLGLSGVLVTASNEFISNTTTNGNGDYSITGIPSGTTSILLTPTLSGHFMNPITRTISGPVSTNIANQDFTSTQSTNFTLTVTSTNGSVEKNPDQTDYTYGTSVTLTATADVGYHFLGWSGDASGSTNPLTITLDGNKNIKANFLPLNVIAFDDFDRANESPFTIGGNWTKPFGSGYVNLNNNQVQGLSGEALYYWQGNGIFDNTRQFARARVINASGQVGLILLGGSNQALAVAWNSGTLYIYWYLNGSHQGELAHVPSTIHDGDIIEALLDGGIIYAKINGIIVQSVPNTTSLSIGNPGFEFYQGGAVFDDWEAGTPNANFYSIAASAGAGGSISPSGSVNVNTGNDETFSITADPGYQITDVIVDGISLGALSNYTFHNVAEDHTISANFIINSYSLTIISANGTVTKNPDQTNYVPGSVVQINATPSNGYIFTGWSGDATGLVNPLTLTMNGNKNITANFTLDNSTYVEIGSVSANSGSSITIPVKVHFVSGSHIPQYILQGKIIFDPTKYRSNSIGSLLNSMGWKFTGYSMTSGEFNFTATGYNPISTNGILFNLNFDIISNTTVSTQITSSPSYWLNNNSNTPAIFSAIHNGTVNITSQSTSTTIGDADGNFNVDFNDAIAIIDHIFGTSTLNGQALINADVDHNSSITLADALGVIIYCAFGDWNYSLSVLSPLSNSSLSIENPVIGNNSIVLPLNIKNAENVRSLEVTVNYDPVILNYESFSTGIPSSNSIIRASEISPGQTKFIFATSDLMNTDFSAGSILLNAKQGILTGGGMIKTRYKINDGKEIVGPSINTSITGVADNKSEEIPTKFTLEQNYPNPFNPTTIIEFRIPIAGYYVVKVFNAIGQTVSILAEKEFSAGTYKVTFNGNELSSGIYFYQLSGNGVNIIRKMMLIK